MNDGRLQHRLALALIVLALWTTDVVASGNPQCGRAREWLFGLSIEELMEVPIDSVDGNLLCNGDPLEAPAPQATVAGASHRGRNSRITSDEIQASLTSMISDNVDYGRYQDKN